MGLEAELELLLAGFYPQGNGQVLAHITPARSLAPLHLPERGALRRIRGISAVANLDVSIAERQRSRATERLKSKHKDIEITLLDLPARAKGTFLLLHAEFKQASACYVGLGALGNAPNRLRTRHAYGWRSSWQGPVRLMNTWRINSCCPWRSPPGVKVPHGAGHAAPADQCRSDPRVRHRRDRDRSGAKERSQRTRRAGEEMAMNKREHSRTKAGANPSLLDIFVVDYSCSAF